MADDVKLCKDCAHYGETHMQMSDYCTAPQTLLAPDLVRGKQRLTYCDQSRGDKARCGEQARYFAPIMVTA